MSLANSVSRRLGRRITALRGRRCGRRLRFAFLFLWRMLRRWILFAVVVRAIEPLAFEDDTSARTNQAAQLAAAFLTLRQLRRRHALKDFKAVAAFFTFILVRRHLKPIRLFPNLSSPDECQNYKFILFPENFNFS